MSDDFTNVLKTIITIIYPLSNKKNIQTFQQPYICGLWVNPFEKNGH